MSERIDQVYCDDCGEPLLEIGVEPILRAEVTVLRDDRHYIGTLPSPVASANAGESAVLCSECFRRIFEGRTERSAD
jgi:hypothetical protein